MKIRREFIFLCPALFLLCLPVPRIAAQESAGLWQQVSQAAFDSEKAASVENVTLVRDRIRITFTAGTIQVSTAAQSVVYGAAFRGKGRIEVKPPTEIEAHNLRQFIGAESLAMDFTEATLSFCDGTFDEIARQVHWKAATDKSLEELYLKRQNAREDAGLAVLPRLFKSILSEDKKRTGLFVGELKTNDKGWIFVALDALSPEEATVGRLVDVGAGTALDEWLSFPAGERTIAAAYADPAARDDVGIKQYRIDARVTPGAELSAVTRMNLTIKASGERILLFELDSNLRVTAVKDAQDNPLVFYQPRDPKDRKQSYGDYIAVMLPSPTIAGAAETLEFTYSGKRIIQQVGKGSYFCQSSGWYPSGHDSFAKRADFEIVFRSPKRNTLIATGSKVSESTDGDWTVTTWKSNIPLAVAGFAFGDFKSYQQKVGNINVETYANPEPDDQMRTILNILQQAGVPMGTLAPSAMIKPMGEELGNMLRVFESFYGPYPFERLALTNIPYSYGQGWPTLIYLSAMSFLDSTQRNFLGIHKNIMITDYFRAHETSHQWWGHRVGWKSYHDQWLSEGFAQFSGNLYVQFRQNDKEYVNRLKEDKEGLLQKDKKGRIYESLGPIWMGRRLASSDSPEAYQTVVYNKGGLVLNTIRRLLWSPQTKNPDERFIELMKDYCATYNNKPASTEDFKTIVEKHMIPPMDLEGNRRMDWFFQQYVYGTGIPEYQIQWKVDDAGNGQWKVSGKIIQTAVPAGWRDVLPLYIQNAGKVLRLGLVGIKGAENPFQLILPYKPEKMMINYFEDTLAIIK